MAVTALTSFIGWIDLSEEDQKRARDYLRSLSEGTLDELGFGIIRDALADRFFPATSTIMTRARFFILVPSIYLHVLAQGDTGDKAKRKCNRLEQYLRKTLIANGSIKNWRKEEVKRYPASIYWAGLRRLGICNPTVGSQANYFTALDAYHQSKAGMKDDDHNAHEAEVEVELWHPDIMQLFDGGQLPAPHSNGQFPDSLSFDLTPVESEYLRSRFIQAETDSVVANVFKKDTFGSADYPWQWDYPPALSREIDHAMHFSMLAKLSTLLYFELLNRKRIENGKSACDVDLVQAVELWWDGCHESFTKWNVETFISWTEQANICRGSDRYFFKTLHRLFKEAQSPSAFVESKLVRDLIVFREKDKRPNKRRLIPGRFQNEWKLPNQRSGYFSNPEHLPFHLDFRSGIASQIIGDIFEGLPRQ